ncbi:MAG: metallophosphoesterase [Lachnospiraceae bacterium]|nr:metallophosphoesterase [Lachnospiraceae bacterium]
MSHYVVGDIHACYDILQKMIRKIHLKDRDELIMVGDYIDRGDQNVEMMEWLEHHPSNVIPVRGNHDENFAYYIGLMDRVDELKGGMIDPDSNEDSCELYEMTIDLLIQSNPIASNYFDMYGTVRRILTEDRVTLTDLRRWAKMFRSFPLYYRIDGTVSGEERPCIVVHAGYREDLEDDDEKLSFFLEARRPAYTVGGLRDGMVVAGHTPTIIDSEFTWADGKVFRHYDRQKNCLFYDIDCGSVFRHDYPGACLACLRLEDEKVFYV